jgi:SAM-dependent methyltransferase
VLRVLRSFESGAHGGEAQQDIACPLCGGERTGQVLLAHDLLFKKPGGYPLVRCEGCALEYVNPRPTPAALGPHYPAGYFGYSLHEDEPPLLRWLLRGFARGIAMRRIKYLERTTGRIEPGRAILDVGCGVNRLLETIRDVRGCTGTGLDFKEEIVSYVRARNMPIVQGTLGSAGFEQEQFDTVLMMEYLEHEPDPLGVLEEARRVTRTGGYLALELPHIATGPGRFFGPNWWNLDIPRHLIFFTPETLGKMLDRSGYELVSVQPFTLPFYVGMSILQMLGLRHWERYQAHYPWLGSLLALPTLPFQLLLPEFMFAVARAK